MTVVAVDKDRSSLFSVRWAIDHLMTPDSTLTLLHIKPRTHNYSDDAIFGPCRTFCSRKGIKANEVMIEDMDAAKGILDYINNNCNTNIVVGACMRNPFFSCRLFRGPDVPSTIYKAAPDFCSVYVICKGKIQSVRPAARVAPARMSPKRLSCLHIPCPVPFPKSPREEHKVSAYDRTKLGILSTRLTPKSPIGRRHSLSSYNDLFAPENDLFAPEPNGSTDVPSRKSDFANLLDISNEVNLILESDELQKVKLELKQTMEMNKELQDWKMEESRRYEQARDAEELALKMAELEKARCLAALEAAEKAQKLADMEAQRRRKAEHKAKRETQKKNRALTVLSKTEVRYRRYTLHEIEEATNKFSNSLKIGEGGYGPVFKAKLDHTPVAIKVLRPDATQGKKQFQQEVEVLSSIRHPNMVLLLGACPKFGCLVYEYMDYGSLEDRLFRKGETPPIPWAIRFKIAAEIATGLLFLHQAKPEPLVHRDLKPGNILLDHNFVCKISDVGLARLVPPSVADSVTQYHMTSAAGTFYYIDPEYQQTGKLGTKSDIYSLGVMLLQIITARPPMGLTHHVQKCIDRGTFADLLDPTVTGWPVEEATRFAKLALKCAELSRKDRPDLGSVIVPELTRLKELGMKSRADVYYSRNTFDFSGR